MIKIRNLIPDNLNHYTISIINHDVIQGHQSIYESIIQQMGTLLLEQNGFLSIDVLRPHQGSSRYIIILYFDTETNANIWLESKQRLTVLEQVKPSLINGDNYRIQTNPNFWFNPSIEKTAPKVWKQWFAAWIAVLPLAIVIPIFYMWLFENVLHWSMLIIGLPISATISFLMTYFIMPFITKLLAKWLSN